MIENLANQYDSYLNNMKYGDSYNVKVHGAQSALNILGYGDTESVNLNTMRYGYYDTNTDCMVSQFQKDHNLNVTGQLDKRTWDGIFSSLLDQKQCIIAKTDTSQVSIIDLDTYLAANGDDSKEYIISGKNTLDDGSSFSNLDSSKTLPNSSYSQFDNSVGDETSNDETVHHNIDTLNPGFSTTKFDDSYNKTGEKTTDWAGVYNKYGGDVWDSLVYNYIVNGGTYYNGISYGYNLNGPNYWNETTQVPIYNGTSDKDYDFIYNLLANSLVNSGVSYDGNPLVVSRSASDGIGEYGGGYDESNNKPFFSPSNIKQLRKSKFDVTIVYGSKGETARKILDVTPIACTQEMDASGNPIFDVYEFVGRDVVYSK